MPLTTPDFSTATPPALTGLLEGAGALGASVLCCDWVGGVTPVFWAIGAP